MFNNIDNENILDIHSKGEYPSNMISNFYPHTFIYDGIKCASIEGILQSLTHKDVDKQLSICKLYGYAAKQKSNPNWKNDYKLYWLDKEYDRFSEDYYKLIKDIYNSLAEYSSEFRKAILSTNNKVLIHTIGKNNEKETLLTEKFFCSILMDIRNKIKNCDIIYKDFNEKKLKDEKSLIEKYKKDNSKQYSLF